MVLGFPVIPRFPSITGVTILSPTCPPGDKTRIHLSRVLINNANNPESLIRQAHINKEADSNCKKKILTILFQNHWKSSEHLRYSSLLPLLLLRNQHMILHRRIYGWLDFYLYVMRIPYMEFPVFSFTMLSSVAATKLKFVMK